MRPERSSYRTRYGHAVNSLRGKLDRILETKKAASLGGLSGEGHACRIGEVATGFELRKVRPG
jgi:hypothetical protein